MCACLFLLGALYLRKYMGVNLLLVSPTEIRLLEKELNIWTILVADRLAQRFEWFCPIRLSVKQKNARIQHGGV